MHSFFRAILEFSIASREAGLNEAPLVELHFETRKAKEQFMRVLMQSKDALLNNITEQLYEHTECFHCMGVTVQLQSHEFGDDSE